MTKGKKVRVDSVKEPRIYSGTKVYLKQGYGSGVKYCVDELSRGFYLIADNKKDYNDGVGYIYGLYAIESYISAE